ncbi:MAG: ATP-binding protein, partial [Myxococcales bacterium]|nr:ATP-binding protein [Myxococcales bacterium]
NAIIRVEDCGAGVPEEVLPQLGRRLLRVDPSRSRDSGGHGLGLSIVRAIAARHDGTLMFERSPAGRARSGGADPDRGPHPVAASLRPRASSWSSSPAPSSPLAPPRSAGAHRPRRANDGGSNSLSVLTEAT